MSNQLSNGKERLLLHLCCAPCSPHPISELQKEFDVTLYFYNPNIHPMSEYDIRLDEVRKLAEEFSVDLIEGEYRPEKWFQSTRGLEEEPERGERCNVCVEGRLEHTATKAVELGIARFGTVLTVSRHKDSVMINSKGLETASKRRMMGAKAGIEFHDVDWKKGGGEQKSAAVAKEMRLNRQDYCGCIPSMKAAEKRKADRNRPVSC